MGVLEDIHILDAVIAGRRKELKEMEDHRAGLLTVALRKGIIKEDLPHCLYELKPIVKVRKVVNTGLLAVEIPFWESLAYIPGPEVVRLIGRGSLRDIVKAEVSSDAYLEALRVNVTDLKKALKKKADRYLEDEQEITGYQIDADFRPIRVVK